MPEYLTPPELAKLLKVDPVKVIAWIKSGELKALNAATTIGGRPRWRISLDAWREFEEQRNSRPSIKPIRRRKSTGYERKYY